MPKLTVIVGVGLCTLIASLSPAATAAPPPEVDALIKQLTDRDEAVRLKAAKELGKLKEKAKDAIAALTVATTDSDEDVRAVAKRSLAAIKEATEKVDAVKLDERLAPLIKDLRGKDNKVRLAAIAKLEELGADARPAGAALVEFGMMSPNAAVKEAAGAAMEKIDPFVHKEIVTVYYDADFDTRLRAVTTLSLMGSKAKAAVPVIKAFHQFIWVKHTYTCGDTLAALVRIAPDDEGVQRVVLNIVGGTESTLPFSRNLIGSSGRKFVVGLMHDLKIEDNQKLAALVSGITQPRQRFAIDQEQEFMIAELGKLKVENKEKYPALMATLAKNTTHRALIINELAKLGTDAKAALPTLMSLKTDKDEAVRIAANAAIDAIK